MPEPRLSMRAATAIVDHIADELESRQPDAHDHWAGGDWRIGRTSRHTGVIYDRALELVPPFVRDTFERARDAD